jgi:hypothetical protein
MSVHRIYSRILTFYTTETQICLHTAAVLADEYLKKYHKGLMITCV